MDPHTSPNGLRLVNKPAGSGTRGRVLRVSGRHQVVDVEGVPWQCLVRGRLKEGAKQTNSPVIVGDWVMVESTGPQTGVITQLMPRRTLFSRGASGRRRYEQVIAVNIDRLFVVVAIHEPEVHAGFIDRSIVMALKGGMEPVVCINKCDLAGHGELDQLVQIYSRLGYAVHRTSALTGQGIPELRVALQERASAFVGQSGVGKSSLINRIDQRLRLRTQPLMTQHDRGRHTTAVAQLYQVESGGYLIDTPGIKELQLHGIELHELASYFVEMAPLLGCCRFRDCMHRQEPGCAIDAAVAAGRISSARYASYIRMLDDL